MEKELNPNGNPIEPKEKKPPGIGGEIENVIKERTESRAGEIEKNENITKLGFVDRLLVKINKFKEGRYDKSIEKLKGKIESIDESIGEKRERTLEIMRFKINMARMGILVNIKQELDNVGGERKKLNEKREELVDKKELKEGRRSKFIEGRDSIINPVVGRLEKSMAEASKNFEGLKEQKKAWDIRNELARKGYIERTTELDDVISRLDKIMGKSRSRELLKNNMKAIKVKREELKNDMDQEEEKFIEFNRKMEEMDEEVKNYQNQIDALKGMKGEEKKEVKEGEKSQGEEKVKDGEKSEGTQEKPKSIVEEWEKMSFKDYVEAWKDFLLNEKRFDKIRVEDFEKIITTAEVEEADREINFDDFEKKIEDVNKEFGLINEGRDWKKTTKYFKEYIEDKKNKSQNHES